MVVPPGFEDIAIVVNPSASISFCRSCGSCDEDIMLPCGAGGSGPADAPGDLAVLGDPVGDNGFAGFPGGLVVFCDPAGGEGALGPWLGSLGGKS